MHHLWAAPAPNPAEVSNDHFVVIVGLISTFIVSFFAFAGVALPLLVRARKDAAIARDQTANNHDSNLRDDMDGKHIEQGRKIDWLIAAVSYLLDRDQNGDLDTRNRNDLISSRPKGQTP